MEVKPNIFQGSDMKTLILSGMLSVIALAGAALPLQMQVLLPSKQATT